MITSSLARVFGSIPLPIMSFQLVNNFTEKFSIRYKCILFSGYLISLLDLPYVINASSFQVVYFTAVFPYVVLLILFFNGIFLSNAGEGIYFYIVPDFSRLLDAGVGDNVNHFNKPDHFCIGKM